MLNNLRLQRFKNFKDTAIELGSFTLLVGTNASGKSNIRDAFRFLHGISRGYSLAEIIGEKWIEGGVLQWRGIRGGIREIAFQGTQEFGLEVSFTIHQRIGELDTTYGIVVDTSRSDIGPRVINEGLMVGQDQLIFDSEPELDSFDQPDILRLNARFPRKGLSLNTSVSLLSQRPILSQLIELRSMGIHSSFPETARLAMGALSSMRFLDLNPEAMRLPSIPGQTVLGDRGENLSSVLQAICEDPERKQTLIQWLRELTPMDAKNFEFPSDFTGKILLTLVEENGQKTSAYSASDGTLRFLAIIAALLGPEPAQFYFFEELENGIHPTRLHLLIELIERQVTTRNIQIVATTHSPQLLGLLNEESLKYASLIYRLEDSTDARIKRILDIPDAKRVIEEQDLVRLHASGWLEDAVEFMDSEEASE